VLKLSDASKKFAGKGPCHLCAKSSMAALVRGLSTARPFPQNGYHLQACGLRVNVQPAQKSPAPF
jgi:hypothetical protein